MVPSILCITEFSKPTSQKLTGMFELTIQPSGLAVASTALDLSYGGEVTSISNARLSNNIASALAFMSLGTTVTSTMLIGYRINSASRLNGARSERVFNHVVVMIIESAALYSLVLLFYAIIIAIPSLNNLKSPLSQIGTYASTALVAVAVCIQLIDSMIYTDLPIRAWLRQS